MYFTSGGDRAFESLMQGKPGFDHYDSGDAGAPEDCGDCRFYRPDWKYQFCVYAECPYQPGKLTALDAVLFQVKGVDDEMAVFRVEKNRGYTVMLYMELLRLLFARGLSAGTNYFYDVFSADNLRQSITLALASAARDIAARLHASQSANSLVSRAVHYIDEHYCEPDLSLDTVAAAVYASPAYLSSLFRQNIGMSFVDYIHDRRIEAAKKLLAAPELTLDEIAERLGYSNVKYFSRVFKKAAGLPPSQYRSQTFG